VTMMSINHGQSHASSWNGSSTNPSIKPASLDLPACPVLYTHVVLAECKLTTVFPSFCIQLFLAMNFWYKKKGNSTSKEFVFSIFAFSISNLINVAAPPLVQSLWNE
jgi:hypothetical protein